MKLLTVSIKLSVRKNNEFVRIIKTEVVVVFLVSVISLHTNLFCLQSMQLCIQDYFQMSKFLGEGITVITVYKTSNLVIIYHICLILLSFIVFHKQYRFQIGLLFCYHFLEGNQNIVL